MSDRTEDDAGWDRRSDPSVRAMIDAEKEALRAENDVPCKHCGLSLRPDDTGAHVHAEGPQEGLYRCAITPYGFNAEPAGTGCGWTCRGSSGDWPDRPIPPTEPTP